MNSADHGGNRAFRGLALVFVLTLVNLIGLMLAVTALGGLNEWSRWQFAGLFGVIEFSAGMSNILAPNIWHLPVAELNTPRRTRIQLAASALLIPHWGGAARAAAGLSLMLVAGLSEGWSAASLTFLPLLLGLIVLMLAVSAIIARFALIFPESDTVQLVVRWRGQESEFAPLSITASLQQFVLGVLTLPAVKALHPGVLFGPEFRPSLAALAVVGPLSALSLLTVAALWIGRLHWHAGREQQEEAESNA